MSKDFEKAYRELAESEIPDLWDRIEAGLESKSTPKQTKESETETEGGAAEETIQEIIQETIQEVSPKTDGGEKRYGKIKRAHFNRYSGIVAVAACAVVCIHVTFLLFRTVNRAFGEENYSGSAAVTEEIDMAAADESMEFAADEAIGVAEDEEESCETASEEMDAGAGALEESGGELADVSQMRNETDDLKKESQSSAKQESVPQEAVTEGNSASAEAAVEGTVFEHVEIKVTEVETDFDREDGSFPGTLYTVTVQKDASGQLKEGEELVVDVPAYSSYALVKGGVFEVDLVYKGNGTYGMEECYRQIED